MSLTRDLVETLSYLKRANVSSQAGILAGVDPTAVNTSDPLRLWILQVAIITAMTQLLGWFLRRIRQPRVISEVISGIILGPTVMGRIPHFTDHIFPKASIPFLSLTANIGLVLFLFLVGLEIDGPAIKRNARLSVIIGLGGMILPFGVGSGLSQLLYKNFIPSTTKNSHFLLFNAVSFSITAFPVLCRILTELKLLDTTVGLCVLSAGVGNDIVGWTLLALTVALVNATSGITALYVILTTIAWALFLLFPVRIALAWFARRQGGASLTFMTITLILVFGSAFFTDVIGVHAIFGGFLVGCIVPRESGIAITLTEKLEDLVGIIFLPQYFILSGLSTDLGLLNTGKSWGFTFLIMVLDWSGKFIGASTGAKVAGFGFRESATVGTFMSCKGLVELIVLNIGLQAGILTPQVFAMFVLDALVLTFCTTPAVVALYPPRLRRRINEAPKKADETSSSIESKMVQVTQGVTPSEEAGFAKPKTKFLIVLDKLEHLPGAMSAVQLITSIRDGILNSAENASTGLGAGQMTTPSIHSARSRSGSRNRTPVSLTALRIHTLDERTSDVMKSTAISTTLLNTDHMLRIIRTFGELAGLPVRCEVGLVTTGEVGEVVQDAGSGGDGEMVLMSWAPPFQRALQIAGADGTPEKATESSTSNPFEGIFRSGGSSQNSGSGQEQLHFMRKVFARTELDVGLFIDRRSPNQSNEEGNSFGHRRLFVPFFGGADDRFAVEFVRRLCAGTGVNAVVVRFDIEESTAAEDEKADGAESMVQRTLGTLGAAYPDTALPHLTTTAALQSKMADDLLFTRLSSTSSTHPRLRVDTHTTPRSSALSALLSRLATESDIASWEGSLPGRLLTVCGRARFEGERFRLDVGGITEVRKVIGDVACGVAVSGAKCDTLVVQAARE